jgi:hypothetical protein
MVQNGQDFELSGFQMSFSGQGFMFHKAVKKLNGQKNQTGPFLGSRKQNKLFHKGNEEQVLL